MADQHPILAQGRDDLASLPDLLAIDLKDHNVGVDAVGVNRQAIDIGQAGRKAPRGFPAATAAIWTIPS